MSLSSPAFNFAPMKGSCDISDADFLALPIAIVMDGFGEGPLRGVRKPFDILPDPGDEIHHRVVRGKPFLLGAILSLQYHGGVEVVVVLDGQQGLGVDCPTCQADECAEHDSHTPFHVSVHIQDLGPPLPLQGEKVHWSMVDRSLLPFFENLVNGR